MVSLKRQFVSLDSRMRGNDGTLKSARIKTVLDSRRRGSDGEGLTLNIGDFK